MTIDQILPTLATKDDLALTTEALQLEMRMGVEEAKRHAKILNEATRDEIRHLAEQMATKSDLQELRRELDGKMTGIRDELHGQMIRMKDELHGQMTGLSEEIAVDLQGLSKQIAEIGGPRRRRRT